MVIYVLFILIIIALLELFWPRIIKEGFTGLVSVGDTANWAKWAPRRGDVGVDSEEKGYVQDARYFRDYVDVQGFGVKHDFCRMVAPADDTTNLFFACALAGTDNLSSVAYKTASVKNGFRTGRDDYMRDTADTGKYSYCRILKLDSDTFEARCNTADAAGFSTRTVEDVDPPENIARLLTFYEGCLFWFRFRDDLVDYASTLRVATAGKLAIEELPPNPLIARTLVFDGLTQYLRVGDAKDMTLGTQLPLRSMRAINFWVRFDEFTNNAHILDFGNGSGRENVFIGIVGKGNQGTQAELERPLLCGGDSVVPDAPSGAQDVATASPQELMAGSSANVDEFDCKLPEIFGRIIPNGHLTNKPKVFVIGPNIKTADMIYEVWNNQQRQMRIRVPAAFTLGEWTHICITADTSDNLRPPISVYKNGKKVFTEPAGFLPQTSLTQKNYIGKSNWSIGNDAMNDKDELFKGALFDLRAYKIPIKPERVTDFYKWGQDQLGLSP